MVHMIYPTSDAVFYISSRTPKTDAEWAELQAKTLTLAESANLLMMPGRARDQDQWMKDARLMLDAGWAAFKAAKAKDVAALEALSDQLYESCVTCHKNYRPDYGKPKPPAADGAVTVVTAPDSIRPLESPARTSRGSWCRSSYTSAPTSNTAVLSRDFGGADRLLAGVDRVACDIVIQSPPSLARLLIISRLPDSATT